MRFKKGFCVLFVCIMILNTLTGCGGGSKTGSNFETKEFEESADFYWYNSLSDLEKEYYAHICTAVEEFKEEIIFTFETEEERQAILEKFFGGEILVSGRSEGGEWGIKNVFYEQAQYFWVNPNIIKHSLSEYPDDDRYLITLNFEYLMDEDEAMSKKDAFNNKVQEIVAGAKAAGGTFEQILYVHNYLCENNMYDKVLYESGAYDNPVITAYGALIEGKTICSGYAMAFSLLMRELGYMNGVEFNNYGQLSIFEGHVWNYVELDGEYYYFDVTWDDRDQENFPFVYEYFGITADELKETNLSKKADAPVPECKGTKYNYYVYNGYDIPEYSFDAVSAAITKQVNAGNSRIYLRFGDYGELLRAETELFTNRRIYELTDKSSNTYYISSLPHLYLYIDL